MMGVFGKQTKAAMYNGKTKISAAPIDGRELRRWMKRNRNSNMTVKQLVEAASVNFGFKPTSYLFQLAEHVIN